MGIRHAVVIVIAVTAVGQAIPVLVAVVEQLPPPPLQVPAVGVTVFSAEDGEAGGGTVLTHTP